MTYGNIKNKSKKELEILEKFRNQWNKIAVLNDYPVLGENCYSFKEMDDNLYQKAFVGIDSKAFVLRSSAAMIYNTIGDSEIILDGKKFSNIEYEYVMPAIDNKDDSDHEHSAHLDVKLESADEFLFIEAKCLEWLNTPKRLKKAYLSDYCYYDFTGKAVQKFQAAFECLLEYPWNFLEDEKKGCYERYDAIQMMIHILGIYNWCVKNRGSLPQKVTLMNIVWDYDTKEYRTEEMEGLEFTGFANLTFKNVFRALGVEFKVEYVRYSEFMHRVDWSIDSKRREYLRRYLLDEEVSMDIGNLDEGLDEKVIGYANELFTLEQLRRLEKECKMNDAELAEAKAKHEKVYNCTEERVPDEILNEVFGSEKHFENECWEDVKIPSKTPYCVSTLGRIAEGTKENRKRILLQEDRKGKKGCLVISRRNKENETELNHSTPVCEYIANAFYYGVADMRIGKPHHIDGNGYDNRVENLIVLTPMQHSKVHGSFVAGNKEV